MKYSLSALAYLFIITLAGAQSSAEADSLFTVGNYGAAIKTYQKLQALTTSSYLNLARAYKAQGNKALAIKAYQKLLTLDSNRTIARAEYGKLLITNRNFSEAEAIFKQLRATYPDTPDFHYQIGRAIKNNIPKEDSLRNKRLLEARNAFAKAYDLDTTFQKAAYEAGKLYLLDKDYPAVERIAKTALRADTTSVELLNLLAQNYQSRGFYDDAIRYWEKLLAQGHSNGNIHQRIAFAYYDERDYDKAITHYLTAAGYEPGNANIHLQLGRLYNIKKDLKGAKRHIGMAIGLLNPTLEEPYYTLALAYKQQEQWEEAMRYINLTLKEDPEYLEAIYSKAVIADNYYKDKNQVLILYEEAAQKIKKGGRLSYYNILAEQRISQLKEHLFLEVETRDK